MKKNLLLFSLVLCTGFCVHKYGITEDVKPKEDVHVFLHPKMIISGYKNKNLIKKVDEINNERKSFDFFIPSGEREIYLKAAYTSGVYAFTSNSASLSLNADKGDIVFICAGYKEISSRSPSGGIVKVLIKPEILYLKTETEKNMAESKNGLNASYFQERCTTAIYGKQ